MAYNTHDVCPLVYPEIGSAKATRLAGYLADAWNTGQDWAVIGDSRVTAPSGRGISFIAGLNAKAAQLFGGMSLLPIASQYSSGGGSPAATFAYRMATNGQGTTTLNTAASGNIVPCGFTIYKSTNAGSNGGSQVLCLPDNHLGSKSCKINGGGSKFWDKTRPIYADVWVVNNNGTGGTASVGASEDFIVEVEEQAGDSSSWSGTSLGTATQSNLGLDTAVLTCKKFSFGPYTPVSAAYHSLNVRGNTAATSTYGVVAQRLRYGTPDSQVGIAYTPMGFGGARIADLLGDTTNGGTASDIAGAGNMKNSGAVWGALGIKGIIHVCGQNDAAQSVTKATVKAAMLNCINTIRGWVGYSIPYIIVNNPYNPGLSSSASTLESTYVQSYTELADTMDNVYLINVRRGLEDYFGWNSTTHPGQVGSTGTMPAGLSYTGNWAPGTSYSVSDVVTINGVNGVALTVSGGAGTFTAGETVTQATSGATGLFISLIGSEVFLQVTSGTFNGSNGLTGGSSGATRNVSAVRFDSLYGRTGTAMPNDFNPRSWWKCISAHTASWGNKPGTQSSTTEGHAEWSPIYQFADPADPAHWNDDGALAVADVFHLALMQLFHQSIGVGAFKTPTGLRTRFS